MNYLWLVPYYISWHYTYALRGFFTTWATFLWFFYNFFSLGILFRTLFKPFERIKERYRKGMGPGDIMESFIFNMISRSVGFVVRSVLIILGVITLILVVILGIVSFIIWVLMPLILGFIFINGLRALLQNVV